MRTKHNNTFKELSKQQVVVDYSLHNPHIDNPSKVFFLRMGDTAMSSRLGIVMKSLTTLGRNQKEKASGSQDDEITWYTDASKNRGGNRYSDEVVAAALGRCIPTTDIHYELRSPRKESLCFRQPVLFGTRGIEEIANLIPLPANYLLLHIWERYQISIRYIEEISFYPWKGSTPLRHWQGTKKEANRQWSFPLYQTESLCA